MLVQTERRHRVETITINRPEARNAIDHDTSEVLDAAVALAGRICRNAPLATRLSKQMVKRSLDVSEDEAFDLQGDVLVEVFTSPDAREGPRSFAEKREPSWASA